MVLTVTCASMGCLGDWVFCNWVWNFASFLRRKAILEGCLKGTRNGGKRVIWNKQREKEKQRERESGVRLEKQNQ